MKPYLQDADFTLYNGDALDVLRELPSESVDCVITSPPYWGLRDYGTGTWEGGDAECDHAGTVWRTMPPGTEKQASNAGSVAVRSGDCKCGATRIDSQLGLEPTPEEYVTRMVEVFREVRRVLAAHGTLWLNMGDSYAANVGGHKEKPGPGEQAIPSAWRGDPGQTPMTHPTKPKDLVGAPWRLAFALQADGWYLRSDIVWSKPNPMPESVTDRPTKAHEYVFLLSKQPRYFFDQEAVREPHYTAIRDGREPQAEWRPERDGGKVLAAVAAGDVHLNSGGTANRNRDYYGNPSGRNIRSVWEIATQPFPDAHFATFPEELVRRCLLAGCPEQVCGECGRARERLTSTDYDNEGRTTNGPRSLEQRHETAGFPVRRVKTVTTEGFTDCGHGAYRPGIVLDPFLGSGTVALVARKHGRRCVGIELNPEYCEMISRRTQQLSLLGEAA